MTADRYAVHTVDETPIHEGLTMEQAEGAVEKTEIFTDKRAVIVRERDGRIIDPDDPPETLSAFDLADLLGVHVATVRRWCRDGDLPAVKVNREFRVSSHEMARWWSERGGGELWPRMEIDHQSRRLDDLARKIQALPDDRRAALAEVLTEG